MKEPRETDIAIIGNKDQVTLMMLAGIKKYKEITNDDTVKDKVREAFKEFANDTSIGIIMVPKDFKNYVNDLVKIMNEQKKQTPIIIEIPSHFQKEKENVSEFYETYTKKLIGFNIEI